MTCFNFRVGVEGTNHEEWNEYGDHDDAPEACLNMAEAQATSLGIERLGVDFYSVEKKWSNFGVDVFLVGCACPINDEGYGWPIIIED